jgi:flagellar biosynthesis protein FlhA
LSPALESEILEAIRNNDTGDYIPLRPDRSDAIAAQTVEAVQPLVASGQDPIVLTSAQVRRYFKRVVERHLPKAVVLSYNEIDPVGETRERRPGGGVGWSNGCTRFAARR